MQCKLLYFGLGFKLNYVLLLAAFMQEYAERKEEEKKTTTTKQSQCRVDATLAKLTIFSVLFVYLLEDPGTSVGSK